MNYTLPIARAQLFAQGEVINAFNRQGTIAVNSLVNVFRFFNPATESAVECPQGLTRSQCLSRFPVVSGERNFGIWQKGASFGLPITPTAGASQVPGGVFGHLQLPRTYRLSVGVKF